MYAGAGPYVLVLAVERMIRTTQNDDVAVAFGCAAALVLEAVILGSSCTAAVAKTLAWLEQAAAATTDPPCSVPATVWAAVAASLVEAAELAPEQPLQAATHLGRNCHLPNSVQTAVLPALHLEHRRRNKRISAAKRLGPFGAGQGGEHPGSWPLPIEPQNEQQAEFCLPCSMGSACPLPGRPPRRATMSSDAQTTRSAAITDMLASADEHQQQIETPADFVEVVRSAIR